MELRNRLTKRALKDKLFYSELTLKHTRNSLASTQTDLETAHSNLEKAKAKLDKVTALYVAERAKNAELARRLKAYELSKPETVGFECVGVENANDYKVV